MCSCRIADRGAFENLKSEAKQVVVRLESEEGNVFSLRQF